MAVSKDAIKAQIIALTQKMQTIKDANEGQEEYAEQMANIIRNAILSAQVNPGITVTTPDTINGATTTPGTLS